MKTLISLILLAVLSVPFLSAQASAEPQVAYRLLINYIQEQEHTAALVKPIAGNLFLGVGASALLGGATLWYAGDDIARDSFNLSLDPQKKFWTSAGLVSGGTVFAGIGLAILTSPPQDFRYRFGDVLTAEDPVLQNRLAAATLLSLSDQSRNERLVSGWVGIATPLVTSAVTAAINVQNGRPWSENLLSVNSAQIVGLIGGVSQLFQRSEEEVLYDKYLSIVSPPRP